MNELPNCPNCQSLFVKNPFRDVCETYYKNEESIYREVYRSIRKRENRTASIAQVVNATGIEESLLMKWIRSGRLQIISNSNLGYDCEHCGEGRFCESCREDLRADLEKYEQDEAIRKRDEERERLMTYYRKSLKR